MIIISIHPAVKPQFTRVTDHTTTNQRTTTFLATCHADLSVGRRPGRDCKRRPGRPRARWIDQVRRDSNTSPVELWSDAKAYTGFIWRKVAQCCICTQSTVISVEKKYLQFVSEHVQRNVRCTQFSRKTVPDPRSLNSEATVAVVCSGTWNSRAE